MARTTSRALAVALALALTAAACGDDGDDTAAAADEPSSVALPAGWAGILDEMRCHDTTVGEFPRTVTHDAGEARIDAAPQRAVSIDGTTSLDLLLLMGVNPVGAGGDIDGPALHDQQAALAGGTPIEPGFEVLVKRPEVNVEAIAALRPDLIISQSGWLEDIDDQVRAIGAPLVVFEQSDSSDPPDWRDFVRIVGEAVGRDACIDAVIDNTEAAIADTRRALASSGAAGDTYAGFIATADGFQLAYATDTQFGQTIVDELGLTLVPDRDASAEFSVEQAAAVLDADHVFAFDYYADGYLDQFVARPVLEPLATRIEILPPVIANIAFYPSALAVRLFVHELEQRLS